MPERREAFKLGFGSENNDPGFGDNWFGIRSGFRDAKGEPLENSTSVARVAGGYRTNSDSFYSAFPEGDGQGELFNWEPPRIKGLYRGENSPKIDLGVALGMAAAESKKRWGVEPLEDTSLTDDSARVVKKLTGRSHEPNYHDSYTPEELRSYGNASSTWVDDLARGSSTNGSVGRNVTPLQISDIEEGSRTIRNKVANLPNKNNALDTKGIKLPSLGALSRTKAFKQETLPGMDTT
jgi:hypothetical protein